MDTPKLFNAETLFQELADYTSEERQRMTVRVYDPSINRNIHRIDGVEIESDCIVFYWFQG